MTVCAVVVTYNRLNLLKECIHSLRAQTRKLNEILVVNNSSVDGTLKWLNEQKDLTVITQPNSGGAGGFHTGIKTAYEKGHDWVWCMDDDGYPTENCLEELIKCVKSEDKISVIGPIVVPSIDSKELSFQTPLFDGNHNEGTSTKELEEIQKRSVDGFYKNHAAFFNGVLISRDIIVRLGLPESKFFIYGDEIEYSQRIFNNEGRIYTYTSAFFIHPENKFKLVQFLNQDIFDGMFDWKAYLYIRNRVYLHHFYTGGFAIKFLFAQIIHLLRKLEISAARLVVLAYYHGIKKDFHYNFTELL